MRIRIATKGIVPSFLEPCSAARICDNVVYISGAYALDGNGELVGPHDVGAQTEHIIRWILSIMDGNGGSLRDVTYNQIFLAYLVDYDAMNQVYREYFSEDPP